ncbi:hypothetical protein A5634_22310 [Mycobacterium asiaticum]|uniref:Helix-turn-helix type 11 domain-containing protein n=1 Tax=Mycobacterium asiaticum TaxID=1790 RepID=A0A1A3P0C3_MYCAS|nr:hypothetical protein [Mycobacterium asiaticum]OBK27703.1 hypothetical protein A5634_22310 [Mycobacterium asiaticum]
MEQHAPAPVNGSPLDRVAAERLDARIRALAATVRDNLVDLDSLLVELEAALEEARSGRIHEARGYRSWPAYAADALAPVRRLELSNPQTRRAVVRLFVDKGLSQRAIAQATGAGKTTVQRDIAWLARNNQVVQDGPPGDTTGTDGKRYPRRRRATAAEPADGVRRGRLGALASAVVDAERALGGLLAAARAAEPEITASRVVDDAFRHDVDLLCHLLRDVGEVGIRLLPTPTTVGLTGGLNAWGSLEAIALDAIGRPDGNDGGATLPEVAARRTASGDAVGLVDRSTETRWEAAG